mmetsp:Transcript_19785/g.14521  ORF Transcript_19785/g.14521 Transcript_19785/m.14521 type:complete len:226 (-) Transcript_19785:222-899(-)
MALLMYNIYCSSLFLSAMFSFGFLMYYSIVRPFKSALYNLIVIYEEFMTFFCFVILFRYANEDSVESLEASQSTAKFFSMVVFILVLVPTILAVLEILNNFRHLSQICNWNRDYQEEKDSFESSEEELKEESVDLLKGKGDDDDLVEKSITLDSSEEPSSDSSGRVEEGSPSPSSNSPSKSKEPEEESKEPSIESIKPPTPKPPVLPKEAPKSSYVEPAYQPPPP